MFWIIQIVVPLYTPLAALRALKLWLLLRDGRFTYKPLRGERVQTTRHERPGWYWFAVAEHAVTLVLYLWLAGFVAFLTFRPH